MILQCTSSPWLETPFEVFDQGVITPNNQHYVSWHWPTFPSKIDVDKFALTVRGHVKFRSKRFPSTISFTDFRVWNSSQ